VKRERRAIAIAALLVATGCAGSGAAAGDAIVPAAWQWVHAAIRGASGDARDCLAECPHSPSCDRQTGECVDGGAATLPEPARPEPRPTP
jgi:hypothetical protein